MGAVVALAVMAGAAQAATIIVNDTGGSVSLLNREDTAVATVLNKGNTYDFVFNVVAPDTNATVSTQLEAQFPGGVAELIQYQVFSGVPGSGVLIGSSIKDFSPTVAFNPTPGPYYVEVNTSEIAKDGEVASGSVAILPVPEPAAWVVMLVGMGTVGGLIRRRRAFSMA
jgi:hypothetical protein